MKYTISKCYLIHISLVIEGKVKTDVMGVFPRESSVSCLSTLYLPSVCVHQGFSPLVLAVRNNTALVHSNQLAFLPVLQSPPPMLSYTETDNVRNWQVEHLEAEDTGISLRGL